MGDRVRRIETEVLVIGSGAGGAVTAATLAESGRDVTVVEEGPWLDPDAVEPFSLDEMVAKYRHRGLSAALGSPGIAFAEGRCVGGSTEINSGLYHRLPSALAEEWRSTYDIAEFGSDELGRYAEQIESALGVSVLPGASPPSSAVLERGAAELGWRAVEFPRVFRYDDKGRGQKQTMARTFIPRAVAAGAQVLAGTRVDRLMLRGGRVMGVRAKRDDEADRPGPLEIRAEHVFVCGGAIQTPTLLQRSGLRKGIGSGLKFHPTVKVAARFADPLDHDDVPMHRVNEFAPFLTLGGSASRRGHLALALADSDADYADALAHWKDVSVYYVAIRSEGAGRVLAIPGLRAPLVTYRLTDADMSRLARGLVHLGEVLLAAGATELYAGVRGSKVVCAEADLMDWWDTFTSSRANLMTVHLTSSVRMGEASDLTGADSFGRIWGVENLRVNDASLIPDAPGVNPQAATMTIALRNCEEFLAAS